MNVVLTVWIVLLVLALCVIAALVVAVTLPRLRAARDRQYVVDEVRFAQWRLQQVTSSAMQRLLDEARNRS